MQSIIVLFQVVLLFFFTVGCIRPRQHIIPKLPPASKTILDHLLAGDEVEHRIRQVEQDLPTDTWKLGQETRQGRYNSSRINREISLGYELISQLKPKLRTMSANELVCSLKTWPYGTIPPNFFGVAHYVYRDGNRAIIEELYTRNRSELELLQNFQNDQSEVFTGDNGPPCNIGDIVRSILSPGTQ